MPTHWERRYRIEAEATVVLFDEAVQVPMSVFRCDAIVIVVVVAVPHAGPSPLKLGERRGRSVSRM